MSDKEKLIHAAKAYLTEAAKRRDDPVSRNFYWVLLGWARNARMQAVTERMPVQGGLFG